MKRITIIMLLIFSIFSVYSYDEQSTIFEVGDDELFIGYFALDTQAYDSNTQGVTTSTSGNGGVSNSVQKVYDKKLNIKVVDDRYESGDKVFSTLFVELPQQLLSQGGFFDYTLVSPEGIEYDIKTVKIEDNKDKLLLYDLPNDANDGEWLVKGTLRINGYENIDVQDSFNVKNYSIFIWYLLAIIVISILTLMILHRRKNSKLTYYN